MNLSRHIATGLATALVCLGCSSDAVTSEQSDLRPLVTTGVGQTTTTVARTIPTPDFGGFPNPPDPTRPMTPQERDYVERVFGSLPLAAAPSQGEVLAWSITWCDFMERGMSRTNITAWIVEMANSDDEAWAWLVSAQASATFICPAQEYKWNP
jgi:hypothetical protein